MKESIKILIAEDDSTTRHLMQELLAPVGQIHVAVNGQQAFDFFVKAIEELTPFNLICLDINMPRMNGMQCLEKIRSYEEECGINAEQAARIIMTTIDSSPISVLQSFRAGCESYVVKPIDKRELFQEIFKFGLLHS
jgi:two-component system chemotaxis response regulator CheY